jgi:predicted enzyme related to lactoylglutathione lyase
VVVTPSGASGAKLLLAKASTAEQQSRIGAQTGGRVFLFLHTDDIWRDYQRYKANGVVFVREPSRASFGTAAVFADLYGNLWDLVQPDPAP